MCDEFKKRYGNDIASKQAIEWVRDFGKIPENGSLTDFPILVREDLKSLDVIESYRKSYIFDKSRFASWRKGVSPPEWYKK